MLRHMLSAIGSCLLVILTATTVYSQQGGTSGTSTLTINVQDVIKKNLREQQKALEGKRSELSNQKSSVESERKNVAQLRRELRQAKADVAREKNAARVWKCNLSGTEHNDPSECDNPGLGGVWITKNNPNVPVAEDRVKDLQKQLADAERQYDADLKGYNSQKAQFDSDAGKLQAEINRAGYSKAPVLLSSDAASVKDYTQRAADRTWSRNGSAAAKTLQSDKDLSSAITSAAEGKTYATASLLQDIVAIESGAKRDATSGRYVGPFQMGPQAAAQVGANYDELKTDWKKGVDAGAKYIEWSAKQLANANVPVNALNVYLSHQQGVTGLKNTLQQVQDGTAQATPATRNQLGNLPPGYKSANARVGHQITVQDFYDYWSNAVNATSSAVSAPPQ